MSVKKISTKKLQITTLLIATLLVILLFPFVSQASDFKKIFDYRIWEPTWTADSSKLYNPNSNTLPPCPSIFKQIGEYIHIPYNTNSVMNTTNMHYTIDYSNSKRPFVINNNIMSVANTTFGLY